VGAFDCQSVEQVGHIRNNRREMKTRIKQGKKDEAAYFLGTKMETLCEVGSAAARILSKKGIMECKGLVNAMLFSISNGNLSCFCSLKTAKSENKAVS